MHKQLILILTITLFCQQAKSQSNEHLIFDRIEYIFNLKPTIAKKYWKGFDKKKYDVPILYYTETASYIANPEKDFIT